MLQRLIKTLLTIALLSHGPLYASGTEKTPENDAQQSTGSFRVPAASTLSSFQAAPNPTRSATQAPPANVDAGSLVAPQQEKNAKAGASAGASYSGESAVKKTKVPLSDRQLKIQKEVMDITPLIPDVARIAAEYAAPHLLYWISDYGGGKVFVIDAHTNQVVGGPIPVGKQPCHAVLAGTNLYVMNRLSENISVIDTTINQVVGDPITVGIYPTHAVLVGTKLYVVCGDGIYVIDTTTNQVVGGPIQVGGEYGALVGTNLYVLKSCLGGYPGSISVIDTTTNQVVGNPIQVGGHPKYGALVGTNLYVLCRDGIYVIDTTTNQVVGGPIQVGKRPHHAVLVGTNLYVVNSDSNTVSVIDTTTNQVVGDPIQVGGDPEYGALVGTKLYVVNSRSINIFVIDTTTNQVVGDPIQVGMRPNYARICTFLVGTKLYVAHGGLIYVIDTNENKVVATIEGVVSPAFILDGLAAQQDENGEKEAKTAVATQPSVLPQPAASTSSSTAASQSSAGAQASVKK